MFNKERSFLSSIAPEVSNVLTSQSISALESNENHLVELFKSHKLPSMFVSEKYGGLGMSGRQAIMLQMAIASRSPSLALMMTMHNFTILALGNMTNYIPYASVLLEATARDNCLVASGFAEGKSGADILDSNMIAAVGSGGYTLNGSKKPCTLARHFDFLTAGISVLSDTAGKLPGLAIIPRDSQGIQINDFWSSSVLSAAGSDEVQLNNVFVSNDKIFVVDEVDEQSQLALLRIHTIGLCWFQLLVSSSYLGVVGALIELLQKKNTKASDPLFDIAVSYQSSISMLDRLASLLDQSEIPDDIFVQSLSVRFCVQQQIAKIADSCVNQLGGLSYIQNNDVQYLLAASRCLAFHPLSRSASKEILIQHLEQC